MNEKNKPLINDEFIQISLDDLKRQPEQTKRVSISDLLDEEDIVGFYNGNTVYRNEDTVYQRPEYTKDSLLDQTPESMRRYLRKSTLIKKEGVRFKQGFSTSEAIVKRMPNEDGKWPTVKGLKKYQALTEFEAFFNSKNGGKIEFEINPGDIFYAPQSGEDKERKKGLSKSI